MPTVTSCRRLQGGHVSAAIVEGKLHFMIVEKRVPNVYRQHALLAEAVEPFASIPGYLVVSELAESADWWFTMRRQDGKVLQEVLPTMRRMELHAALVTTLRGLLMTILAPA